MQSRGRAGRVAASVVRPGSELARTVIRATREGRQDGAFWKSVAERTRVICEEMSDKETATILQGLGKMGVRDKSLLVRLAEQTTVNIGKYSVATICSILVSFARLEFRSELLFNAASRQLARTSHQLTAGQTAQVFFAYSRLNYRHPTLFKVLGKHAVSRLVGKFEPQQLASLCASVGALQDDTLMAIVASEIAKQVDQFTAKHLTTILITLGKNGRQSSVSPFILELLVDQSYRKRMQFPARDYALVLHVLADLRVPQDSWQALVDFWLSHTPKDVEKLDMGAVATLASGVGKLKLATESVDKVLDAVERRIPEIADQLTTRHVASLVHAFGKVRKQSVIISDHMAKFVSKHIESFSLDELAMIVGGFARLDIQDDAMLVALFKLLPNRLAAERTHLLSADDLEIPIVSVRNFDRRCSMSALVAFADMMGRFYIREPHTFELLVATISARSAEISAEQLSRVLKAAIALQHTGPEVHALLKSKFANAKWVAACPPEIAQTLETHLSTIKEIAETRPSSLLD